MLVAVSAPPAAAVAATRHMTSPIGSVVNRFAIGLSRDGYSPKHIDLFAAEFFMETLIYSALLARGWVPRHESRA
jgi:tRNA splicing endonuclease